MTSEMWVLLLNAHIPRTEYLLSRFIQRYREQYMDAVFKLSLIVDSIGKMADGAPPPTLFQSLYHLRRLFPNGLLAAEDFRGEVGTSLLVRLFALGVAVANQAIYEQRNLNMDWSGWLFHFFLDLT
jgi:hypothetical protein